MTRYSRHRSNRFSKLKLFLSFAAFCVVMAVYNHCINPAHEDMDDPADEYDSDLEGNDSVDETVFQLVKRNDIIGVKSFSSEFPDQNDVQMEAAQKNGVTPLESHEEIDKYLQDGKLVYIGNSPFFQLGDLTHSIPYLTPKAYHLVNTICVNFLDSLLSKGMQPHLPVVTSVLRTSEDINKLRRGNRNSVERSAHRYGTTVDIAYTRFVPLLADGSLSDQLTRHDFQQKLVMAEVLRDLRNQGKCYVKYELHQACFHLTVR